MEQSEGKYDGEADLKRALADAKVKPTARAETLSLEESAAIFRALRKRQAAVLALDAGHVSEPILDR